MRFLYISQKLHIYLCPSIAFLLKYDMKDYNDTLYISFYKNSKIKHEISFSHIKWREIKKKHRLNGEMQIYTTFLSFTLF